MAKMGRPLKEIDKDQFEKLCALMSTENDIAAFFDCSVDTLYRWCLKTYCQTFAETYRQKSSAGRNSLRRKQYEVAMSGNVTMLIWLGKIMLEQKDPSLEWRNFDQKLDKVQDKQELIKMAEKILSEVRQNA